MRIGSQGDREIRSYHREIREIRELITGRSGDQGVLS
jgi:hypothetical protein